MKFIIERDLIIKEIQVAQEIISSRTNMSILSNVLLDARENELLIRATDLKVSFETTVAAAVQEQGTTTVLCDKFLAIPLTLPSG